MNTEANSDEILNLDYNFSKLVCRALDRSGGNRERAAVLYLGIGIRTIYRYIKHYRIVKNPHTHRWEAPTVWFRFEKVIKYE